MALHKRSSVFEAKNYRGVHLTPQISKAVERMFADALKPFIDRLDLFGTNQFAYAQGRGARDAVAFLTLTWIQLREAAESRCVLFGRPGSIRPSADRQDRGEDEVQRHSDEAGCRSCFLA